jgi:hypothetical protein
VEKFVNICITKQLTVLTNCTKPKAWDWVSISQDVVGSSMIGRLKIRERKKNKSKQTNNRTALNGQFERHVSTRQLAK